MAKNGKKSRAQLRAEHTPPQTRGRPSRKDCIWDDKQRDRFLEELRDNYTELAGDISQIIEEFAKALLVEMTTKQRPRDESSVVRAIRFAIADEGRRALPASYVVPTIRYLGLNEESIAILFPQLSQKIAAFRNQNDNWQQPLAQTPTQVASALPLEKIQTDTETPFSWPSRTLATREDTPQWADFEEPLLNSGRLRLLKCVIATTSPYFRFGFKLLTKNGKLFGDGSIQSQQDMNLLVHIGRNNFARPRILANDVFLTSYRNGVPEGRDRKVFESSKKLKLFVALAVDDAGVVQFFLDDVCYYQRAVPLEICQRVVMFGWGDREDFVVKVSDIVFSTTKS